jgi:hypothetical protein
MCDVSKIKVLNESHPATPPPSVDISLQTDTLVNVLDAEQEHIQHHYHRRKTKPICKRKDTGF